MKRRECLVSIGAIGGALLAGCSSDSSTPTPRSTEIPTETDTPTQPETASDTPTKTPSIDESKVYVTSSSMDIQAEDDRLHVHGTVQNDNNRDAEAALGAMLYDSDDNILDGIQSEFVVIEGGTSHDFAVEGHQYAAEADDYVVRVLVH